MFRLPLGVLAAFSVLAVPAWALAGNVTLHPSGFGQKSYAAWKAQEGLQDRNGAADDQALYFQKLTSTTTFAAGVAVFKGVRGFQASELEGTSFWYRVGGHCGAGAPRFTLIFEPEDQPGHTGIFHVGCAAMAPTGTATNEHGEFIQKTFPSPPGFAVATACETIFDENNEVVSSVCEGRTGFPSGTIQTLAIIFDEGTDVPPNPADPGFGSGRVHLDNIEIIHSTLGPMCWTGAQDNGKNDGPCPAPQSQASADGTVKTVKWDGASALLTTATWDASRRLALRKVQLADGSLTTGGTTSVDPTTSVVEESLPVGVGVDLSDLELVDALTTLFQEVPLTDWVMYPDVLYPNSVL